MHRIEGRRSRVAGPRQVGVVDVGTARLRVAVQGAGQPLLLVSGIGGSLEMWDLFEPHLDGFQVITFDPPGTGESSPVRFPLGIGEVADLAAQVLAALGQEQVDVLGYSWGGAVAQELANRHPLAVRRLVLCATTCGIGGLPGTPAALAAFVNPWRLLVAAQAGTRHPPNLAGSPDNFVPSPRGRACPGSTSSPRRPSSWPAMATGSCR